MAALAAVLIWAALAHYRLPYSVARFLAVPDFLAVVTAAVYACSGVIVLLRYTRSANGRSDLFLKLNRRCEPSAITSSPARRRTRLRRWFARHTLGHDLIVGDWVEIKSWSEIRTTLDPTGRLEEMPFMPEMLAMCGKRARVFRSVHRVFDYRKSRRMRHMHGAVLLVGSQCDGASHGGCEAACHVIWKAAWLRRLEPNEGMTHSAQTPPAQDVDLLRFGTTPPCYSCQLTQMHAASQPVADRSILNFFRPLIAGNVTLAAFCVGRLTYLFNGIQHRRGGDSFPFFEASVRANDTSQGALKTGDDVIVRSSSEIRATLNDQFAHRGMGFETDMLKYCGRRLRVQSEITKLIDIVTGEMRTMKTPAYILDGAHFSGERQLFNAQYEPLFWRAVWLRKEGRPDSMASEDRACDAASEYESTGKGLKSVSTDALEPAIATFERRV